MVGGRWSVRDGEHVALDVAAELRAALRVMTALVVDHIGLLVTNDPALGEGALGLVRDAALVMEDGVVDRGRARGRGGGRADRRGRALRDPGVRRLAHAPRVRGRPGRRVRGADGGRAVRGGRHPRDDRGDARRLRASSSPRSRRPAAARRCGPASRTSRSSRATASTSPPRQRSCEVAAALTDDVTFLGAHVVPAEYEGRADDYVALVCGEMLARLRAARALDRRLLRGRGVRRGPVARGARGRPRRRARPARARQPARARARACGWRSSWARPPSTTAPT